MLALQKLLWRDKRNEKYKFPTLSLHNYNVDELQAASEIGQKVVDELEQKAEKFAWQCHAEMNQLQFWRKALGILGKEQTKKEVADTHFFFSRMTWFFNMH